MCDKKKGRLSGSMEEDLSQLRPALKNFLKEIESSGTEALAADARNLKKAESAEVDQMLIEHWQRPADLNFFPKAFLQPYARLLAEMSVKPVGRSLGSGENRCRFCEGKPQVAYLKASENEGGSRYLICSFCLSSWLFRRMVCPACGEEDPAKIGYYQAPEFEEIRVDTCSSCNCYIKCVDLTKSGIAVPLVDEIASAALDLWAREKGFAKIELNLVGL